MAWPRAVLHRAVTKFFKAVLLKLLPGARLLMLEPIMEAVSKYIADKVISVPAAGAKETIQWMCLDNRAEADRQLKSGLNSATSALTHLLEVVSPIEAGEIHEGQSLHSILEGAAVEDVD